MKLTLMSGLLPADYAELDRVCCELEDMRARAVITRQAWGEPLLITARREPRPTRFLDLPSEASESRSTFPPDSPAGSWAAGRPFSTKA